MQTFPPALLRLINELTKLPSIGEKSATRLAYHLVTQDKKLSETLAKALLEATTNVCLCEKCFFLSEESRCPICKNEARDKEILCVVERPIDLIAIERVGQFGGYYHVLHGLWAPLRGQGPEQMRLKELLDRVRAEGVKEVILATNATVEGDATALYLAKLLSSLGVKSTRLAQGMPKGGELEYADEVTLSRAFAGRNQIGG
jgi:recombination protein RecR